ncbi:hypothetical protein GF338_10230, partial [candidate division WOR-3 bacterium]|nr:hypothetical protein [candidate division WOR-3 bacterium]
MWDYPYEWNGNGGFGCWGKSASSDDEFRIYADNELIGTTDTNFYCIYTPCEEIEVVVFYDGEEGYSE